jgi:hypothetical protein
MTEQPEFYYPNEIAGLLKRHSKPKSSFYNLVKQGAIQPEFRDGEKVYSGPNVRAFLNGELHPVNQKRQSTSLKRRVKRSADRRSVKLSSEPEIVVDVATGEDDFLQLYLRESDKIGYIHAITVPLLHAWSTSNGLISWFAHPSNNRANVVAMLTIVPVPETTIRRLLAGEISFSQIPPDEILTYQPGEHYNAIIVSAAATAGRQDAILLVARQVFADLGKRSIQIDNFYALADRQQDSPLMRLISHCAFTPLDRLGKQWVLEPFYREFQPADFVAKYRSDVSNEERKLKNMLLIDEGKETAIAALRNFFNKERSGADTRQRDLAEMILKRIHIDADGRILRTNLDQEKQRDVFVRPIKSDDDLRAAMLINASLFGASKRFTLDQLVERRRPWVEKNPDTYRILEVERQVLGYVFIIPLPRPVLDRLLAGTTLVGDISVDDLQDYQPGKEYDLFLHTLGIHKSIQDNPKKLDGFYLLAGVYQLFVDLARRGIRINNLYTRSNEYDGVNWAAAFGMEEITVPGVENKLVMHLDFSDQTNRSLQAYRDALAEYEKTTAQ